MRRKGFAVEHQCLERVSARALPLLLHTVARTAATRDPVQVVDVVGVVVAAAASDSQNVAAGATSSKFEGYRIGLRTFGCGALVPFRKASS